jgi:hypothetical protein
VLIYWWQEAKTCVWMVSGLSLHALQQQSLCRLSMTCAGPASAPKRAVPVSTAHCPAEQVILAACLQLYLCL